MKRPKTAETVSKNIKMLLDVTKLSVAQVSVKSGVPKRTIYGAMNLERVPGIDTTDDIAGAFGLTGWQLLMPNLHYDLARSGQLETLIEEFSESTPSTQNFITEVLKREQKSQ